MVKLVTKNNSTNMQHRNAIIIVAFPKRF